TTSLGPGGSALLPGCRTFEASPLLSTMASAGGGARSGGGDILDGDGAAGVASATVAGTGASVSSPVRSWSRVAGVGTGRGTCAGGLAHDRTTTPPRSGTTRIG